MRAFIKKIEKGEVRRLAWNAWKRMETHANARGQGIVPMGGRQVSNMFRCSR